MSWLDSTNWSGARLFELSEAQQRAGLVLMPTVGILYYKSSPEVFHIWSSFLVQDEK